MDETPASVEGLKAQLSARRSREAEILTLAERMRNARGPAYGVSAAMSEVNKLRIRIIELERQIRQIRQMREH